VARARTRHEETAALVTRDDRLALARWLARFQGAELLLDWRLDDLAEHGVRYSRIENVLMHGTLRAAITTLTREDVYARFSEIPSVKFHVEPGRWRAVLVVDVALACCQLAGIPGDPAHGERGTVSRFKAYVRALQEDSAGTT
jgi:hypothetical protein